MNIIDNATGKIIETATSAASRDEYEKIVSKLHEMPDAVAAENAQYDRDRARLIAKNRIPSVPQSLRYLSRHEYSDDAGTIHLYNDDGSKMSSAQAQAYLGRMYGSGD